MIRSSAKKQRQKTTLCNKGQSSVASRIDSGVTARREDDVFDWWFAGKIQVNSLGTVTAEYKGLYT